jgi:apolipoprotein N-acyltransferase
MPVHPPRVGHAAAFLSGVLLALSFPHPGWWPLAWFALVPLLVSLREKPPAVAAGIGFTFGLAFYGLLLTWLLVFGPPAYAVVVLVSAAYSAAFGALFAASSRGGDGQFVVTACLAWVVVEWLRTLGSASFPWGLLGYSQWTNLPVLQLASLGGVYLVSAAVVAANAGLALLWRRRPLGVVPLVAVALAWLWGTERLDSPAPQAVLPVAALQPNLPQRLKLDADHAPKTQELLLALTREAVRAGAKLVVWPEHYWPTPLLRGGSLDPWVRSAVPAGVALLATGEIDGRRNSALVVQDGRVLGRHDKARLVPLGEWWADPGPGYRPVPAPQGPAGVLLCYEVVYPASARALVLGGARYLIHSTEEGWFGKSAGPVQHLSFAVVRAVELGRDVVRAASIGISGTVDRTGRLRARLPQTTQGWVAGWIEPRSDLTPYARWGDLWVWAAAAALGLLCVPSVLPWLRRELVVALVVPGLAVAVARLGGLGPLLAGLLLAAATLAVCPDWGKAGLVRARHPASVAGSAAFAAAAVWLVHAGFSAQGIPLYPQPWEPWRTVVSTVAGAGEELWLRGLLPSVVPRSPLAAFALSELGTLVLHGGARGEVVAWHLVSGAVFFAVRRVTGSVWGPVLARGVGDAALWSLLRL